MNLQHGSTAEPKSNDQKEGNRGCLKCETSEKDIRADVCCLPNPIPCSTYGCPRALNENRNDIKRNECSCDPSCWNAKDATASSIDRANDARDDQVVSSCYKQRSQHGKRIRNGE